MKYGLADANNLLMNEFEDMKIAYNNDLDEYDDGDELSCYTFYSWEFRPFILNHLQEKNTSYLKKIFCFVERLFEEGDDSLVNMVGIEICEGLYYEDAHENFKDVLLKYCGKKTLQSFIDCFDDEIKAEWKECLAA